LFKVFRALILGFLIFGLDLGAWSEARSPDNNPATILAAASESAVARAATPIDAHPQQGKKCKTKGLVKIATIGAGVLPVDINTELQQVVDIMIDHWRKKFALVLPDKPDLIVVPEACDCPSGWPLDKQQEYYRVRKDQVQNFFAKVAKENNCYIVYSAIRETEDGSWRNSSVLLDRKGNIAGIYNKNHPMVEETTQAGILCGRDVTIIDCDFGRVGFVICFDLNFDELRLKYVKAKPDLLIFSSMYHGGLMQAYWAYSCRCHFVGAIAGDGTASEILDPLGRVIASTTNYFDYVTTMVNLDCCLAHLDYNWGRLNAMKDKYGPKVKIVDPGCIGSVLIASEDQEISVEEMVREFKIELLDDYMKRALAHRHKAGNME